MKKIVITLLSAVGMMLVSASPSLAASLTLTNGGLGQVASNPQQFGVAVCAGSEALTESVPVTVSANGETATISSAPSIATGACEYSYISYNQLGMRSGQTYAVNVVVDADHAFSSNSNNETTYSVTVPAQSPTVAAVVPAKSLTADEASQSSNLFSMIWNWFGNLFHSL